MSEIATVYNDKGQKVPAQEGEMIHSYTEGWLVCRSGQWVSAIFEDRWMPKEKVPTTKQGEQ